MAPTLAYPDFTKDFVLETDASKQALGLYYLSYRMISNFIL